MAAEEPGGRATQSRGWGPDAGPDAPPWYARPTPGKQLAAEGKPRPPVTDNALAWKELLRRPPWWTEFTVGRKLMLGATIAFVLVGSLAYRGLHWLAAGDRGLEEIDWLFLGAALLVYSVILGFAAGVTLTTTAGIAREREQQTLDSLLTLPGEWREILFYKWLAGYYQWWPLYALSVPPVLFAVGGGLLPVRVGLILLIAPWPVILFLNALALYLSVRLATVLTANVCLAVVVLGWVGVHLFLWANYPAFEHLARGAAVVPLLDNWHPLALLGWIESTACVLLAGILAVLAVRYFESRGAEAPAVTHQSVE
jgi:hypothetical protein